MSTDRWDGDTCRARPEWVGKVFILGFLVFIILFALGVVGVAWVAS